MRFRGIAGWCLVTCLALPMVGRGQSNAEIHTFVQGFYDWYVANALRNSSFPAAQIALKQRGSLFGARLAAALREDFAAQAATPDDIVGLDFDPFLNTQDSCEHYEAGAIIQQRETYSVEVHAICSGKKSRETAVVAEVIRQGDGWKFVNFRYPDQAKQYPNMADLLSILKMLREDRAKPQK